MFCKAILRPARSAANEATLTDDIYAVRIQVGRTRVFRRVAEVQKPLELMAVMVAFDRRCSKRIGHLIAPRLAG
jgi:hypothetical protein